MTGCAGGCVRMYDGEKGKGKWGEKGKKQRGKREGRLSRVVFKNE